jgi:hypothetical protein
MHSRFQKGVSGNPRGRPHQWDPEPVRRLLIQEAFRPVMVRMGEKTAKMPALQAVSRSQITLAIKGNMAAQRAVIKIFSDLAAQERKAQPTPPSSQELLSQCSDAELADMLAFVRQEVAKGSPS